MNIIIPIGGLGERFKREGYTVPKPLVNVLGKKIIFWLLDSLKPEKNLKIYIPYHRELTKHNFENVLYNRYKDSNITFHFHRLEDDTRGAAETVKIMLDNLDCLDESFLLLDSDVFYGENIINAFDDSNVIFYFKDYNDDPIYSYIKLESGRVVDIKEKKKISHEACVGAYGFRSGNELLKYINRIIDKNIKDKNEFYISTVYGEMLKDDIEIKGKEIKDFTCLGTPFLVKLFANYRNSEEKTRFCFDIDNTLLSYPHSDWYDSVKPLYKMINIVKKLYEEGHHIILYTARRMKTHNGDVEKVVRDIGEITIKKLKEFGIPYHELYFGKPYADFYVDDLSINSYADSFDKESGFYDVNIEPRYFNSIEYTESTIIKKSKNLSGEIYYYRNMPDEIRHLFPKIISNTGDSLVLEKIEGLNMSYLYSNKLLTIDDLQIVLEHVENIHDAGTKSNNIDIYKNYHKKFADRYTSYDYSRFNDSDDIYTKIKQFLLDYENNDRGEKSVIHGDPVFSNIFLCRDKKIKFIDMRGTVGNINTILGDKFYDYGKIYQSIIGYDFILNGQELDLEYIEKFKSHFKEYIIGKYGEEAFNNIVMIANSLLFSLIPLHDNNKCNGYYKLISL